MDQKRNRQVIVDQMYTPLRRYHKEESYSIDDFSQDIKSLIIKLINELTTGNFISINNDLQLSDKQDIGYKNCHKAWKTNDKPDKKIEKSYSEYMKLISGSNRDLKGFTSREAKRILELSRFELLSLKNALNLITPEKFKEETKLLLERKEIKEREAEKMNLESYIKEVAIKMAMNGYNEGQIKSIISVIKTSDAAENVIAAIESGVYTTWTQLLPIARGTQKVAKKSK